MFARLLARTEDVAPPSARSGGAAPLDTGRPQRRAASGERPQRRALHRGTLGRPAGELCSIHRARRPCLLHTHSGQHRQSRPSAGIAIAARSSRDEPAPAVCRSAGAERRAGADSDTCSGAGGAIYTVRDGRQRSRRGKRSERIAGAAATARASTDSSDSSTATTAVATR